MKLPQANCHQTKNRRNRECLTQRYDEIFVCQIGKHTCSEQFQKLRGVCDHGHKERRKQQSDLSFDGMGYLFKQ